MALGSIRILFGISMCLILMACTKSPSERALRDMIQGLQATVTERDAGRLTDILAEDFIGPDGLDRNGARRFAALQFMRQQRVGITTGPLDIRMQGEYATVRFEVIATGSADGWLPQSGQAYGVESGWRFEDGKWRMTSLRWTPRF